MDANKSCNVHFAAIVNADAGAHSDRLIMSRETQAMSLFEGKFALNWKKRGMVESSGIENQHH